MNNPTCNSPGKHRTRIIQRTREQTGMSDPAGLDAEINHVSCRDMFPFAHNRLPKKSS